MQPSVDQPTAFIEAWASVIKQRKLTLPALVLLEAHKPLSFVVGQFLLVGQPLFNLFLPAQFTQNAVQLCSERTSLEQFIQALERD